MTEAPRCQTCFHHVTDETRGAAHSRCTRHHKMRDGKIRTMAGGTLCVFERDQIPEPQREPNDKCGPEGIHWRSRL